MTDVSTSSLHPSLRELGAVHRRRLRLLGLRLFLTMAGVLILVMVIAFTSRDIANLLLLGLTGLVMLPIVALLGGLMWYLDHRLSRRLSAADRVLRECTPRAARLTPAGPTHRARVLVALHPLSGKEGGGLCHALINASFCRNRPPAREITVQLYCRDLALGNELVALQPDGNPLLGKVVEWKGV
jgi:hypothetical protein